MRSIKRQARAREASINVECMFHQRRSSFWIFHLSLFRARRVRWAGLNFCRKRKTGLSVVRRAVLGARETGGSTTRHTAWAHLTFIIGQFSQQIETMVDFIIMHNYKLHQPKEQIHHHCTPQDFGKQRQQERAQRPSLLSTAHYTAMTKMTTTPRPRPTMFRSCSIQTVLLLLALGLLVAMNIQQSLMLEILSTAFDVEVYNLFHHSPPPVNPATMFAQQQESLASTEEDIQRRVLDVTDESIRSWGCNVTATPFIFVHIGKAGGGNVRRRLAGAARDFTRNPFDWKKSKLDDHYYPVINVHRDEDNEATTTMHKAKFCSSGRHRHSPVVARSFEHYSQRCTATTPIGHILACPEIFNNKCLPFHPMDPNAAHLVYAGHNLLGSELHWLPIPYLQDWWNEHWSTVGTSIAGTSTPISEEEEEEEDDDEVGDETESEDAEIVEEDKVQQMLATLDGILPWCQDLPRPLHLTKGVVDYDEPWDCAQQHLEPIADALAESTLQQHFPGLATDEQWGRAFGQFYASLPVTRATVIREPISWLLSKWAWHQLGFKHGMPCDDIETATALESYTDLDNELRPGWVALMSLHYILYLCGEDCHTRLEAGKATLEQVEAQAAYNLRNSFAVVGLLKEQDTFFEMIDARVDYMDMHLNTDLYGDGDHQSRKDQRCEERFKDEQFKQELVAASPELQALVRLYEIGLKVNQFQMQELEQCSGRKLAVKSTHPQDRNRRDTLRGIRNMDMMGTMRRRYRDPRFDIANIRQKLNNGRRRPMRVKGAPGGRPRKSFTGRG